MKTLFLSWHGSILTIDGPFLTQAPIENIISGSSQPLLSEELHTSVAYHITQNFLEFPSSGTVCTLSIDGFFLSSRNEAELQLVPNAKEWEYFLPISFNQLLMVHKARSYALRIGHEAPAFFNIAEHQISLHAHRWKINGLQIQHTGDTLFLSSPHQHAITTLSISPPAIIYDLINTAQKRLSSASVKFPDRERRVNLSLLRVRLQPYDIAHHIELAHACALCEMWDLAQELLLYCTTREPRLDCFYYLSICSFKQKHFSQAAHFLKKAFDRSDEFLTETISDMCEKIQKGQPAYFELRHLCDAAHKPYFGNFFDEFLVPMPLPAEIPQKDRALYSNYFEYVIKNLLPSQKEDYVNRDVLYNGASYWTEINKGHNAWLSGHRAAADIHYENAKNFALRDAISPVHYNSGIFSWLSEKTSHDLDTQHIDDIFGISSWSWHESHYPSGQAHKEPELGIVFGCNSGYFDFIPKLLLNLLKAKQGKQCGRIRLCLGIHDPTPKHVTFLHHIQKALSETDFGIDITFLTGTLAHADGAAFTAIRYLILPRIANTYSCPIITADCDGYFPTNFIELWENLRESSDYGFRLYAYDKTGKQTHGEPWGFGAGISYFGEKSLLPSIATFLHNYIQRAYSPQNVTNWCIDQCALVQAFQKFIAPRWEQLRVHFMDENTPLMIMPHHVGGKRELLLHGGVVSRNDVIEWLSCKHRAVIPPNYRVFR
ncbi:hypothetical protein GS501_03915 [Saccharibacter sp. 17.LH.SD]|uniref:hypothetical protein n=1 Tax=Saccharibacter sp. 17.LH.SD TaxID=2689393 RepID=UPI001367DE32|nr:hypothetical protein [Saccharibacter sp. 17.LH.SD]MXV44198.1 hypothetical protein [Saccharibacter sp. 17.LH.SD]